MHAEMADMYGNSAKKYAVRERQGAIRTATR